MKTLAGVRQEILDHVNKSALTYMKQSKSPITVTQTSIKSGKQTSTRNRLNRGHLVRAPSIESGKNIVFNKLRNRTIAKVNIGGF
jgi:hypothetical protein